MEPQHVERFLRFSERMYASASQREGFISLQRQLIEQGANECVFRTCLRFATIQQCMSWLDDPQRRRLLLLEEEETGFRFQGRTSWMGYGRRLSRRIQRRVATWKVNLLVLLALYPTAMLMSPLLNRLLVPALSRVYRPWLEGNTTSVQAWLGLVSLLLWIALLWCGFTALPSARDTESHGAAQGCIPRSFTTRPTPRCCPVAIAFRWRSFGCCISCC